MFLAILGAVGVGGLVADLVGDFGENANAGSNRLYGLDFGENANANQGRDEVGVRDANQGRDEVGVYTI